MALTDKAQGQRYTENHTNTVNYTKTHYSGSSVIKKFELFSCDLKDAPERVEHTSMDTFFRMT